MKFLVRATSSGSPGGLKTFATFVNVAREVFPQLLVKVLERVLNRQGHAAAECAERGEFHRVEQVVNELAINLVATVAARLCDEFLAARAAEAAGKTLPATLVGGELEEVLDVFDHRERFRDAHDTRVTEQESRFLERLEID